MTTNNYIIGTGYYGNKLPLFDLWMRNTDKYAKPKRIYVVNAESNELDIEMYRTEIVTVDNLGHVGDMPASEQLGGWSAGFILGAMCAYHCHADFIYKEQDCLAFGPWVDLLYKEIGNHGMIVGRKNVGDGICGYYGQSLVLLRRWWILDFIQRYLALDTSDKIFLPEYKFQQIMEETDKVVTMSIGYDRTKPVNMDDPVWYGQQFSASELSDLRERGLI